MKTAINFSFRDAGQLSPFPIQQTLTETSDLISTNNKTLYKYDIFSVVCERLKWAFYRGKLALHTEL